jgi:hypothetical protein
MFRISFRQIVTSNYVHSTKTLLSRKVKVVKLRNVLITQETERHAVPWTTAQTAFTAAKQLRTSSMLKSAERWAHLTLLRGRHILKHVSYGTFEAETHFPRLFVSSNYFCNRPRRPVELLDGDDSIFSRQFTDSGEVVSLKRRQRFTLQKIPGTLFMLEAESTLGPRCGWKY